MLYEYKVGDLYNPRRTHWDECATFNYSEGGLDGGGQELLLFMREPTNREIAAVKRSPVEIGLYVAQPHIILCYEFPPEIPVGDAPYTIHRVAQGNRSLAEIPAGTDMASILNILLIDASTGILRAMRVLSTTNEYSVALHEAVLEQSKHSYRMDTYDRELRQIVSKYSSQELFDLCQVKFHSSPSSRPPSLISPS